MQKKKTATVMDMIIAVRLSLLTSISSRASLAALIRSFGAEQTLQIGSKGSRKQEITAL